MAPGVRALRGATTVDQDTSEQISSRTTTLLRAMLEGDEIDHDEHRPPASRAASRVPRSGQGTAR